MGESAEELRAFASAYAAATPTRITGSADATHIAGVVKAIREAHNKVAEQFIQAFAKDPGYEPTEADRLLCDKHDVDITAARAIAAERRQLADSLVEATAGLFGRKNASEATGSARVETQQPNAPREADIFGRLSAGLDASAVKPREWTGDPRVPEKDRELYVTPPPVPDSQMVSALGSYLTDLLNARKQR